MVEWTLGDSLTVRKCRAGHSTLYSSFQINMSRKKDPHQQPIYRSVPLIEFCTFILNIKQVCSTPLSIHEINAENTNVSVCRWRQSLWEAAPAWLWRSGRGPSSTDLPTWRDASLVFRKWTLCPWLAFWRQCFNKHMAWYDDMHLRSQHLGGWGRRIMRPRPAWANKKTSKQTKLLSQDA